VRLNAFDGSLVLIIPLSEPDNFSKLINNVSASEKNTLITRTDAQDLARRWMLAACGGAFSGWHIDASGYGTYLHMWAGAKLWYLKSEYPANEMLLSTLDEFGEEVPCVPLLLLPGDDL
jgi:hypothetical protein